MYKELSDNADSSNIKRQYDMLTAFNKGMTLDTMREKITHFTDISSCTYTPDEVMISKIKQAILPFSLSDTKGMQKAVESSLRDPLGAVSVELTKCRARAVTECDGTKESFQSLFEASVREIKGLSVENVIVDMEVTDQFGLPWDIGAAAGSMLETPGDKGYTLSDRRLGPNGAQGFPLDRWRIPVRPSDIPKDLSSRVEEIRSQMPNSRLKNQGNMATANVDIFGMKKEFTAHSRINSPTSKGANIGDFSYLKPKSERMFTSYVEAGKSGEEYSRYHDTEAKILEDIASKIDNPNIYGIINLYTEAPPCRSCTNIIFEFRRKFPNIQLNVHSGR